MQNVGFFVSLKQNSGPDLKKISSSTTMGNEMSCCGPRSGSQSSSSNSSSLVERNNRKNLDDGAKSAVELIVEETDGDIMYDDGASGRKFSRKVWVR